MRFPNFVCLYKTTTLKYTSDHETCVVWWQMVSVKSALYISLFTLVCSVFTRWIKFTFVLPVRKPKEKKHLLSVSEKHFFYKTVKRVRKGAHWDTNLIKKSPKKKIIETLNKTSHKFPCIYILYNIMILPGFCFALVSHYFFCINHTVVFGTLECLLGRGSIFCSEVSPEHLFSFSVRVPPSL